MSAVVNAPAHDHHEDHGHHHKQTFISKYIFSFDHKMVAKQFLITGLLMGIVGIGMSILFRIQLAWPEQSFAIFEALLGKWAPDCDDTQYLSSIGNYSWYHHGILCAYCRIKWYV